MKCEKCDKGELLMFVMSDGLGGVTTKYVCPKCSAVLEMKVVEKKK